MKTKYIIGIIVIVVFGVWGAATFLNTTIKYVSIAEARQAKHTVQVSGLIDFSEVQYDAAGQRLVFTLVDLESPDPASAERMTVYYYGVVPGNFEQATSVLVRGKAKEEGFVAEQLFVKCPSKYQGQAGQSI
ncbi:MAG: cytochrome c maturation protein CcmE [Candidatus Zixiibacteriota bacterium]|nr:MAG: cytochrome c maturation protein CcmE [candidate division Zixibacteria bacterium]